MCIHLHPGFVPCFYESARIKHKLSIVTKAAQQENMQAYKTKAGDFASHVSNRPKGMKHSRRAEH
jgi:hypothetical protein